MNLISIFTDISTDQSSELQKEGYKYMTCENSTSHEKGTCELIKLDTKICKVPFFAIVPRSLFLSSQGSLAYFFSGCA